MQIRLLPHTITYVHGTSERLAKVDALELCIAVARHISLMKSPMVDELAYQAALRELASGRGFHSEHAMGADGIIDLTTSPDGKDLIVMFADSGRSVRVARPLTAMEDDNQ